MAKNTIDRIKSINLLVLTLILAAVIISGCTETKPELKTESKTAVTPAQLDIIAKGATGLIITHKGGTPLVLRDVRLTVKKEVNDKVIDGLNAVPMYGNDPEVQEQPAIETLESGMTIKHIWVESLLIGDGLLVTIKDTSGNIIYNKKIKVS